MLFGIASYESVQFDEWGLKMSINLLDEDMFQVVFEHSQEHQKEVGRLTVTPEFEIRAMYNNQILSFGDYMRNIIKDKNYEDKILSWDTVIYTIPSGNYYTLTDSFSGTYGKLPKGNYFLYKKVRFEDKDGNYSIKIYSTPFSVNE